MHAVVSETDYRAFRGTAMGSHNWVEVEQHRCLADALGALEGYQILAAHPAADVLDYRDVDYTLPTALVLGTEKAGLDAAALAAADHCIAIPMCGMVTSYNVSVAAGIILAEAQRQREAAGLYDRCRLTPAEYRRLLFEWAHPRLRDFCQQRGIAYPPMDDNANIVDGAAWYARVREGQEAGTVP
jgi:tRNA (guanosine-2'-O-)-methyltransferase